jgi:hypothetical protein
MTTIDGTRAELARPATATIAGATGDARPGWIKPAAIGGGVLAGIGGVALALRSSSTPLRMVGAGIAAVAGAALLTGCGPSNTSAARGNTPEQVVDAILRSYDHSGNGQVELDSPTGLPKDDERLRMEYRNRKETTTHWNPNDEDFLPWGNPWGDSHTTRWSERRVVSGVEMFNAANEDGDRIVTREELLDLVRQYDDFGDGKLDRKEIDAFRRDNPERHDDWVRTGR